jgi:hypothetical protein
MSQENVDLVYRALDATSRHDLDGFPENFGFFSRRASRGVLGAARSSPDPPSCLEVVRSGRFG